MKMDIKGNIPKKIANMGMSSALDTVYHAYKYFQRDEEIDELEVSLNEMIILSAEIPDKNNIISFQLTLSLRLSSLN